MLNRLSHSEVVRLLNGHTLRIIPGALSKAGACLSTTTTEECPKHLGGGLKRRRRRVPRTRWVVPKTDDDGTANGPRGGRKKRRQEDTSRSGRRGCRASWNAVFAPIWHGLGFRRRNWYHSNWNFTLNSKMKVPGPDSLILTSFSTISIEQKKMAWPAGPAGQLGLFLFVFFNENR